VQLDNDNPWPGLESFEEDAHAFFFGRNREINLLRDHVLDTAVTVLYGRSGLGKTSLLHAGLFPLLRTRHFLPIHVRFALTPGATPLTRQLHSAVRDSIRAEVADGVLPSDEESIWEYVHRNDFELWSTRNYPLTPVIVLDQFEELFTLGERVADLVNAFRDQLGDLAENRIPADLATRIDGDEAVARRFNLRSRNYKLLISLREDFLPDLEGWCRLIPTLGRSRVRLLRLSTDQALDAVHEPAAHMMTNELARRVVDIIAGEGLHPEKTPDSLDVVFPGDQRADAEVEPALLSLFCRELNEERKRRGQAGFDDDLIEDAKHDTLSNYYSSCVRGLEPRVARFIESELITEKGFRDSYIREDAVPAHLTEDELHQLISLRLLRLEDRYGAQRIELTHDVLTAAVREHRDRRRADEEKATLTEAAKQAHEREQAAHSQAAAEERAKLEAQEHAQVLQKRTRALRLALMGTAIVAVVALVLACVAVIAWHRATTASHEALGERLTSEGQAILAGKQPGSELAAFVKLIAAQHISSRHDLGGLLNALNDNPRLRAIDPSGDQLSGDGQRVTERDPGQTQLIDTQTWKPVGHPLGDRHGRGAALSFTGRYLASVNDYSDKAIRLWDFDTGSYIGQPMLGTEEFAINVAVSLDGRRVAANDIKGHERLWDTQTGRLIATLPIDPDGSVSCLTFSPDGRWLATAGNEHTVRLWDAETGALLRETTPAADENIDGGDQIESLTFSPDGSVIAAGGQTYGLGPLSGGTPLRLWNTDAGALVAKPIVGHYGTILALAFSPDGRRIATGSNDKTVRLWDAVTGQPIGNPQTLRSRVEQVAFTGDGNKIVAVSRDTVQTLDGDPDKQLPAEMAGSKIIALRSDDRFGLDSRTDVPEIELLRDETVQRLNADTGRLISVFASDELKSVQQVTWSRDRRWLAIAGRDNTARVVDTSTGQFVNNPLTGHNDSINSLDFSPDGNTLATASDDKTIRLWDWHKGQQIGEPLTGHKYGVKKVVFSQNGTRLLSRSIDGSIWIWDTTKRPPTGKQIGANSSNLFSAMTLSPDSHYIATGSLQGTIQQWDASNGDALGQRMDGHNNGITEIAYSPDGHYLVSVGAVGTDDTLRFWDAGSGRQIGEPVNTAPMGDTAEVSFSKDGHGVYVVTQAATLTGNGPAAGRNAIWQLPAPAEWEHSLCEKLTVNPSDQQWRAWIANDIPYTELCPGKPRAS
jgi:WD40 repeat protein